MSKVLENRKSSFALATKKETELTHLLSITYHNLYRCCFSCYLPTDSDYYKKSGDLACEDRCYVDFLKVQGAVKGSSELTGIIDDREECMTECFKAKKGTTDSVYCIEKCNETFNARLKKVVANVSQAMEAIM